MLSFFLRSVSMAFRCVLSSVFCYTVSFLCFFNEIVSVYSFSFSKVSMLCGTYYLRDALFLARWCVNLDR